MGDRKRSNATRFDSGSYPDFSDPSDYIDDITEDELLSDVLKEKPDANTGVETVIILDGLPVIPQERMEKLKTVIRKLFGSIAKCQPSDILNEIYPMDENNMSKGFAFFEFSDEDPEVARRVKEAMDNYRFDKQHVLSVDLFTDFDKYANYPDEWEEPTVRPYKEIDNLRYFLENDDCYDQYLMIWGELSADVAVFENSPVEPSVLQKRHHWTDGYALWSPFGSYLATFHQKGLALWGGPEFKQITRLLHQGVISANFSPKERYILTIRKKPDYLPVDDQAMVLWDVVTGSKKNNFPWDSREAPSPTVLKWSPDENFLAMMTREQHINIWDTENFNKTILKLPGVIDFTWSPSPSFNHLAYWVREIGDVPARLGLYEVLPGEKTAKINDVRNKQLFSVTNCEFNWQKNGEYMAVKVHRYKHSKKTKKDGPANAVDFTGMFYNLEIFTVTSRKEVPVESIEIRDNIVDLAWEPNGNKLVVLTVSETVTYVNFFSGRPGNKFELIKRLPLRHKVDRISWSPMGQFVVLHTSNSGSVGYLIFVDTSDLSILADVEHFLLSEVQWDPTGRYVTAITCTAGKKDNGYTLYSFQGRYIRSEKVEALCLFTWRPRPPTLLSEAKQKEIRKNIKKYGPEFEAKDKMLLTKASKEVSDRRKKQLDEFMDYWTKKHRLFEQGRNKRLALRGGVDTEALDAHPDELVEEQLEVMLSMTTTNLD